ncbi:MAG: hypothetical protein HXS53_08605 [Theionarchaea archaeon]|nr:hypothetical protein [Theionarchaea archaeon]
MIIYIIVWAIALFIFILGTISMASFFYFKRKNIEMDFISLYRDFKGIYPDLGLELHETLLIFVLLNIGLIWFSCISDTFRIPLIFIVLGFFQLIFMMYAKNKIELNRVEVK